MAQEQQCTEDRFLQDAGSHVMTVIHDDGLHRHLAFRKPRPAGSEYWFQLITYPGELVITGDMGTYVFRRLEDMFEFFRTDREYKTRKGNKLAINPGYWGEKLTAIDRSGFKEFSAESFRTNVKEAFDEWVEGNKPYADDDCEDCTKEQREAFDTAKANLWQELNSDVLSCADDGEIRAFDAAQAFHWEEDKLAFSIDDCWEWGCKEYTYLWQELNSDVLSCADDGEIRAFDAAQAFHWEEDKLAFSIDDCWEWGCKEYTFHFLWCCYAIAWGIKTYDESKTTDSATAVAESAVTS